MQFQAILTSIAAVALMALPAVSSAQTPASPRNGSAAADEALVEMNQAFRRGDRKRLAALLSQTRGHALEAWAAYWELKARLDEATPQEVQDTLARYPGTYQQDRLRNDWLLLLGQRRDWTNFAAEYPLFRMNDDREVRCYALLVDHIRTGAEVAAEVRRNWHGQREADDGCAFAADRLYSEKKLTALDVWRKARLAIDANRPRAARAAVEIVAPDSAAAVTEINNSPARYLGAGVMVASRTRKELIVLALIKMASNDADAAAGLLENKWGIQLTPEERNWAWGAIGKQAASRLADNANDYFGRVSRDADLTDEMLAWKVRAALRQGQWKTVLGAVNAMSDEARADPTWAYWKARALLAGVPAADRAALLQPAPTAASVQAASTAPASPSSTSTLSAAPSATVAAAAPTANGGGASATTAAPNGTATANPPPPPAAAPSPPLRPEVAEARRLLESIASVRGFYEQLALEELGRRVSVPPRPAALTPEEKEAARLNPGLNRALYAIALGLRSEGVREWNYSTNLHTRGGLSERELLAAADFACQREVWDRCINTSERTRTAIDFEQRFPMPFRDAVVKRSREIGLDPAYVYGLIRQESRFIMDARSGVGASGLMQVMPATARWTARKIGLAGFTADQITDRDTNIAIGTGYLKIVLDDFAGSMPLAAAAYNAGPNRPRSWRNGPPMEAAIWAENVPFSETRDYVKKVLSNTTNYAAILGGTPQSLKSRLGNVGPRDSNAPEISKDIP